MLRKIQTDVFDCIATIHVIDYK